MGEVALVLGAGGFTGQAYHAGVLAALADTAGWDARTADVVVGSSAGSLTGTLIRLGVGGPDLAALSARRTLSPAGAALVDLVMPDRSEVPAPSATSLLRPLRPPQLALLSRLVRTPWNFRPGAAAATLLPAGRIDVSARARALHQAVGHWWPAGLWICAVRRDDGSRVVFGRDGSPRAPLAAAVLASCAVPAYFTPVTIHGVQYLDGGVHSPTNGDVLAERRVGVVVVVSPLSGTAPGRATDALMRRAMHRKLEREARRLEDRGSVVIRVEPGPDAVESMGLNPMDERRTPRVVEAAWRETVERIAAGQFAALGATRATRQDPVPA